MSRAVWALRVLGSAAFLCVLAAIWFPDQRWQWLATAAVCVVGAGMVGAALDSARKEQQAMNVVNINSAKGNGDHNV